MAEAAFPPLPRIRSAIKRLLLAPALFVNTEFLYASRLNMGCARGAANVGTLQIDASDPRTWEFSAFSQNGEDGIIQYLIANLRRRNSYFVEVGSSDGLENNTAYLAFVKKYSGVMIDADPYKASRAARFLLPMNWGVRYVNMLVTPANVRHLLDHVLFREPDVFSVDIDGNDYFVVEAFLEAGFRPQIICVEYNSAFGPESAYTMPYDENFNYLLAHPTQLYYGASVTAWRRLLRRFGYDFVTVESRGVNAFFVAHGALVQSCRLPSQGLTFAENVGQLRTFGGGWKSQWEAIGDMPVLSIEEN